MRWISGAVAAVTVGAVAWLGFSPTSAGLSNGVEALECRAVFAPIEGASLVENLTPQQEDASLAWLTAVGYVDEGDTATAEHQAAIVANVQSLCAEAQQTRTAWITVAAVFGSALALGALTVRRRETVSTANEEVARG